MRVVVLLGLARGTSRGTPKGRALDEGNTFSCPYMLVFDSEHERPGGRRRYFPKPLLTEAETAFWGRLRRAVPDFIVLPQVAMGALVDPAPRLTGEYREKARRRFQSKIVDFAVYDPATGQVVCLVELDDPSHEGRLSHDVERDALTLEAGYVTLRWDVRERVSDDEFAARILQSAQYPDIARQRALAEHEERRMLAAAVEQPSDNVVALRGRLPTARRAGRPRGSEPSIRAVAIRLAALSVLGVVGYWAVPYAMKMFLERMVSSVGAPAKSVGSPPRQALRAPAAALAAGAAMPSAQRVLVEFAPCVVYGDAAGSAQAHAAGCPQVENVRFFPERTPTLIGEWARYNDARLDRSPPCPPYGQWSQEIRMQYGQTEDNLFASLNELYADALQRGCLRAPHAVPGAAAQPVPIPVTRVGNNPFVPRR